jgi:hypothetical protein
MEGRLPEIVTSWSSVAARSSTAVLSIGRVAP